MKFKTFFSELQFGHNDNSYFKNFAYSPADPEERDFGELFMVVEILNNPGGAEVVAKEMFAKMQEVYYSHLGEDDYTSFETALREVNGTLREMLERSPQKWLGRINAIAAVESKGNLHLSQTGAAEAYLFRNGKLVKISENIDKKTKKEKEDEGEESGKVNTFMNISSGEVADDDQIIFSTEHLLRVIPAEELELVFNKNKGMSFLAALQDRIRLEEDQAIGLGFAAVSRDHSADEVAPVEDSEPSPNNPSRLPYTAGIFQKIIYFFRNHLPRAGHKLRQSGSDIASWGDNIRQNTDRRTATFALVIMAVVLIVGVMVVYSKNSEQRQIDEFQKDFTELKDQIAKAERQLLYNPEGAASLLIEAEKEAERLLGKGLFTANIETTQKQIRSDLDKVYGIERILLDGNSQIETIDLSSTKSDIEPIGLIRIGNTINAFDRDSWYGIVLNKISSQTIMPGAGITTGTYFPDQEVTVFLTEDGRLIEWTDGQAEFVKTADETFHDAVAIGEYSRYLYFLDPENNQIWKYGRDVNGYSQASTYNNNTDLTKATGIAIDGDIYISASDGNIIQIFRGDQTEWFTEAPDGIDIAQPRQIRTSIDGKSIYVLDRDDRILQFTKSDGMYFRQFVFEVGSDKIRDFVIDDENMEIFVLVGSKIHMVPMGN